MPRTSNCKEIRKRIILYIRDISDWKDELKLPRFHVAHCSTLQTMIGNGKKKRYVVSQNENDLFHLHREAVFAPDATDLVPR